MQTHCGWHEPVLPGGDDSVAAAPENVRAGGRGFVAVVVAVVVAGVGGLLF